MQEFLRRRKNQEPGLGFYILRIFKFQEEYPNSITYKIKSELLCMQACGYYLSTLLSIQNKYAQSYHKSHLRHLWRDFQDNRTTTFPFNVASEFVNYSITKQ